jgi:hypothetical protein
MLTTVSMKLHAGRVDFDIEHVDAGEALEQDALAFHHRLAGQRAEVAQAEDGGAVGDHRDQIALVGVAVGVGRILAIWRTGSATPGV